MRLSPRTLLLVLYLFLFILLFSQILGQLPVNEVTIPYIVLLVVLFLVGLLLILAWDYIIPLLLRSYRLGECKVEDKKYIICRYKNSPELTGYVMLKVVPSMPIADMPKERRESMLQTIQGLLKGAQYELVAAYVAMKDRYHENIIKRLEEERQKLLVFAQRESLGVREMLRRIDTELQILRQVPVILEGFYIALVRAYATDEDELKILLEANSRALMSKLEGLSAEVRIVEGEELRELASYLLFGSVVQLSI